MSNDYWVRAKVGPYSWTVESGDLASEVGAAVQHLDGWSVGWAQPDDSQGQLYPDQLASLVCQMYVRTLDTDNLFELRDGDPMALEAWTADPGVDPTAVKFASFYGRLTDCDASPYIEPDDTTWLVYSIQGTDYLPDLAQVPVPAGAWPSESVFDRVTRIMENLPAPLESPTPTWPGVAGADPTLAALDYPGGDMLSALLSLCVDATTRNMGTDSAVARPMIVPMASYAAGLWGFEFQYWAAEMTGDADYLPGDLALVDDGAGGYQLVIDWDTTALDPDMEGWAPAAAFDSATILRQSLTWKLVSGRVNAMQVTSASFGSLEYANGELPKSLLTHASQLTAGLSALNMLSLYVPPAGQAPENWRMSDFVYRVPQAQLEHLKVIPDHDGGFAPLLQLATWPSSQPVVVYNVQDGKSPTGRSVVTGRLQACQLTIVQGRVELTVRVRRGFNAPFTSTIVGVTMDELNAAFPDVTDQPRHTANALGAAGGFETGGSVDGWAAAGNCTIAQNGARAKYGTGALRLTSTAGAGNMAVLGPAVAAVPGQVWCASGWVNPDNAGRTLTLALQFYTAAMGFISQVTVVTTPGADAWADLGGAIGTAPATTAWVRIAVQQSLGALGELTWIDGMQLELAPVRNPYEGPDYPTRYLDPEMTWDDLNLVRSP